MNKKPNSSHVLAGFFIALFALGSACNFLTLWLDGILETLTINHILAVVYIGLFLFGCVYNLLVAWLVRKGYAEGYMGFIVAVGVGTTLLPFTFMTCVSIWWVLYGFAASGVPMILGDVWRYIKPRAEEQAHERQADEMAERGSGGPQ